jgi:hypothetical protein
MGWRFVSRIRPSEPICNRARMDSEGNTKNYYSQILFLPSLKGGSVIGVTTGVSCCLFTTGKLRDITELPLLLHKPQMCASS